MNKNFRTLDGMRGVAALFVAAYHTKTFWTPVFFWHSYLAVDLFFVLSGFVIAHAYGDKLRDGQISTAKFALIRMIRLYPMYFLATGLAITLSAYQGTVLAGQHWRAMALAFAFLPSTIPASVYLFPFNPPCWSVFYELVANVVYAMARSVLVGRMLLFSILVLGIGVVSLAFLHGDVNAGVTWRAKSIVSGLVRSFFGLLYGIFIYRHRDRFDSQWNVPALAVIAVIAAIFAVPKLGPANGAFDALCCCIIFPACVLFGAQAKPGYLGSRICEFVGRPSYTIYLIHAPLAAWVVQALGSRVAQYAPFSGIALFVLLVSLSNLMERLIDVPVRSWLRTRLEGAGSPVRQLSGGANS